MTKESKFDTAMGAIAGLGMLVSTQLPASVPWWAHLVVTGVTYLAGKLASPGVPGKRAYDSMKKVKPDDRGQIADEEEPR